MTVFELSAQQIASNVWTSANRHSTTPRAHGIAFQEKQHAPTLTSEESAAARRTNGGWRQSLAAENR